MLGHKVPLKYTDYYNLIDIPVHFFTSTEDKVVLSADVEDHYKVLKDLKPDLAHLKVFEGISHVDMVCFTNHIMMDDLKNTLKSFIII